MKRFASFRAVESYAVLSCQVSRGTSRPESTPRHSVTTSKPKTGSFCVGALASEPEWIASTMARLTESFTRFPTPYEPPLQPVLTSQTFALWLAIFSASSCAYLAGCQTRNGPPKHGEKVACGSVTPTSVPATFAV